MTSAVAAWALASALSMSQSVGPAPPAEIVAEVRVHGNHVSTDEDVIRLAGVRMGAPFTAADLQAIRVRLRDAHRFDDIEVLKRYASIADPSKITIVIIVNEGPVRVTIPDMPGATARVVKRRAITNLMVMPIVDAEDGYGLTFGARLAYAGISGKRGRLSFPLTWGGTRRAGAELEHAFQRGPLTRVEVGASLDQQRNPALHERDRRGRIWMRAERAAGFVRAGATIGWQRIEFADIDDRARTMGADVTFDTRLDPVLPRNAVYAKASWTRWHVSSGAIDRRRIDARGYLGIIGQTVLVARVQREDASAPPPPYLQSLLGGWSTLRGFRAGAFVDDTLVAGTLELRVPLSSALSASKTGVTLFVDTGETYAYGARFDRAALRTGIGVGVWKTLAAFQVSLSVAHGRGASTRSNFSAGFTF